MLQGGAELGVLDWDQSEHEKLERVHKNDHQNCVIYSFHKNTLVNEGCITPRGRVGVFFSSLTRHFLTLCQGSDIDRNMCYH
jgi:hypothetical protein